MAEASPSSATLPPSPLKLQDRVALVTGGSRGIGRAIALHLASLGAKLIINYTTNSTQATLLATQINSSSSSPRAIHIQADISDPVQVKHLFDSAESAFDSPIHILVNSAGVLDSTYSPITDTLLDDFDRTFRVNTRGAFLCCKEAASRFSFGGRIVCMTSSMVLGLKPGFGAYAASKAAVEAMVKVMAKELKGRGITANCVAPGPIATEMFYQGKTQEMVDKAVDECPLGRLGEVEDVAPVVGFLQHYTLHRHLPDSCSSLFQVLSYRHSKDSSFFFSSRLPTPLTNTTNARQTLLIWMTLYVGLVKGILLIVYGTLHENVSILWNRTGPGGQILLRHHQKMPVNYNVSKMGSYPKYLPLLTFVGDIWVQYEHIVVQDLQPHKLLSGDTGPLTLSP